MRSLLTRLAILAGVVLVLALPAVSTGSSTGLALSGVSLLLAIAALRVAAAVVRPTVITVGARSHAHREALSEMAAPRHPATAGRPQARAPGFVVVA